jgi:hypothetical protein
MSVNGSTSLKRPAIAALAIALTLGLAGDTGLAAQAKKFKSQVEIDGQNVGNEEPFEFRLAGDVHSRKPKCERNRAVSVYETAQDGRNLVGTATTDRTGDWELIGDELSEGQFTYEAEIDRREFQKPGKDVVCKADISPPFPIPTL